MRLSSLSLSESIFDVWGPAASASLHIKSEPQDDTNCLVAYRLYIHGKVFAAWVVSLNGQHLGTISRFPSRFGVRWETNFATKYDKDVKPGFVQIMTAQNRKYLEDMLKKMTHEIEGALSARRADVVRLPIDPAKI
jgi:hypothetical protein